MFAHSDQTQLDSFSKIPRQKPFEKEMKKLKENCLSENYQQPS